MVSLSVIKSGYGRGDVAPVLAKLFAHQPDRVADPDQLAARLVDLVWAYQGERLRYGDGRTPHKLVIAALALTEGYRSLPEPDLYPALTIALSNVLAELEVNGSSHPTTGDEALIAEITAAFAQMLEAFNNPAVAG